MTKNSIYALAALLALAGCSQPSSNQGGTATDTANTAAPVANTSIASTSPAAGGTATGVPACDNYVSKLKACLASKVPAAQRAQYEQALDQSQKSWSAIGDKGQLAQACEAATAQAKTAYGAMGCEF